MKKAILLVLSAIVTPAIWATDITAIFGGGNPDTGWTTVSGSDGLLLGLRAKDRNTSSTANVGGTYTFATPLDTGNAARAKFNYEFSISTSSVLNASGLQFFLSADTDPTQGISYLTINPLTVYGDNSYGTFGVTANGAGLEGLFSAMGGLNNFAQNSQNIAFLGMPVNVANATYNYELYAVDVTGARQATVGITVVVGQGGDAVPDAGSTAGLLGLALVGLAGFKSRKRAV